MRHEREVCGTGRVRRGRAGLRRPGRTPTPATTSTSGCRPARMRLANGGKGLRLLDAGCGTGASTAALLSVAPQAEIVAVDASAGMLAQAARQALAGIGPVRAQPHRGHRGRGCRADRSTASSPPTCCATSPTPTRSCASSGRCCGRARLWRCTSTRSATRGSRPPCGTRCARRSSSRWARCAPATRALYRYLRRSVNQFDGAEAFRNRLRANGFVNVRSETVPGWQRNIVHTFLAEAPR